MGVRGNIMLHVTTKAGNLSFDCAEFNCLQVPQIDLSLPEQEAAVLVHNACKEFGFLYLKNHGVPGGLIAEMLEMQQKFFALPLDEKKTIQVDKNNRGYTPMSEWQLDPKNSKVPDTHEGLYFGREVPADSEEAKKPLHGPNQWPAEDLVPGYRTVVERYFEAMSQLSHRMLRLLAIGLELPPDYFAPSFDKPIFTLRPLRYSAAKSSPEDGAFGIGAHSDYGMITFLLTDAVAGLQICPDRDKGEWVDVPPVEGAFICNIGDLLERWTNDLYRSTLHRVVNTTGQERYSIPFFLEPNFDCEVVPLPQCCKDSPPKYPPTTCGQHLLEKLRASYAGSKEHVVGG